MGYRLKSGISAKPYIIPAPPSNNNEPEKEYDAPAQLPMEVGMRVQFKAENDDMEGGYEFDMGTIVEVNYNSNPKWIIIRWDGAGNKQLTRSEEKVWTKKYYLPLSADFSIV
jgi:hypothetical protein